VQDGSMGSSRRMAEYSAILAAELARHGSDGTKGLVANEGKHWVITARNWLPPEGSGVELAEGKKGSRHNGANYGWYAAAAPSKGPGGERVFQPIGLAHSRSHADYSQVVQLMGRTMLVDDAVRDAFDVIRDPELCHLLSDEGPLPSLRHPDQGESNV
jgi:hypothetical protein